MEVQPRVRRKIGYKNYKVVNEFGRRELHISRRESFISKADLLRGIAFGLNNAWNYRYRLEGFLVGIAQRFKGRVDAA